jgi:hypothetical protein
MRDTVVSVRRTAFLVLVVALVAGCGGTKSYTASADAICKKYTKQTTALGTPKTIAEIAVVADKTLPILEQAEKELRSLEPPPDKRAAVGQWLAQFRTVKTDVREIRDKAQAGDPAGVTAVALRAQRDNAKANALGTRLGFKVCNRN